MHMNVDSRGSAARREDVRHKDPCYKSIINSACKLIRGTPPQYEMPPRVPVELRTDPNGRDWARCKVSDCRKWKPLSQFCSSTIQSSKYVCRKCKTQQVRDSRFSKIINSSCVQAEVIMRKAKARESARNGEVCMDTSDVGALLSKFGGTCPLTGETDNLTIARVDHTIRFDKSNAIVLSCGLERAVHSNKTKFRGVLEKAVKFAANQQKA